MFDDRAGLLSTTAWQIEHSVLVDCDGCINNTIGCGWEPWIMEDLEGLRWAIAVICVLVLFLFSQGKGTKDKKERVW